MQFLALALSHGTPDSHITHQS